MGHKFSAFLSQSFRIPKPPLTEENLPDQSGKVFIITGANTGIGYQVAKILYSRNGTVYVAARTESKAQSAIDSLKTAYPASKGQLHFLKLNLSDLSSIKASAEDFLSRESKLHWLDNNAGVMIPPKGSKGAQGLDLQYQTNILGPFLFTKLLLPVLKKTAETEPKGSVRVSWAGSLAVDMTSPQGGVAWKPDGKTLDDSKSNDVLYGTTKAANYFLAYEFGRRFGSKDGVLHNSYNPGNLRSELQRHADDAYPSFLMAPLKMLILYPVVFGAYTELYAGLSQDLSLDRDQAIYIVPWGRKARARPDVETERGEGKNSAKLYEWCETVTKEYA